jgi:hypothetical protein
LPKYRPPRYKAGDLVVVTDLEEEHEILKKAPERFKVIGKME